MLQILVFCALAATLLTTAAFSNPSDLAQKVIGDPQVYVDDWNKGVAVRQIEGAHNLNRTQVHFINHVIQPLIGRGLIRKTVKNDDAAAFRKIFVEENRIRFSDFEKCDRDLVIFWGTMAHKPSVAHRETQSILTIPTNHRFNLGTWSQSWLKTLLPEWLDDHRASIRWDNIVKENLDSEVLARVPTVKLDVGRSISDISPIDPNLEGALLWKDLRPGMEVLHPTEGTFIISAPLDDDKLRGRRRSSSLPDRVLNHQSKLIFAVPNTPAAKELSKNRALAFAPVDHIRLLLAVDFLDQMSKRNPEDLVNVAMREILGELLSSTTFTNVNHWVGRVKATMRLRGLRHDTANEFQQAIATLNHAETLLRQRTSLEFGFEILSHLQVDRYGLALPRFGFTRVTTELMEQTTLIFEQLKFLRQDIVHSYVDQILKKYPASSANDFAINVPFYTSSHELHDSDPFTVAMSTLSLATIFEDTTTATDIAEHMLAHLDSKIPWEALKEFDVITYAPGSTVHKNAAYYLAKSLAKRLNVPLVKLFETKKSTRWRAQKTMGRLASRLRNSIAKFSVPVKAQTYHDARVLIVDDKNTSGITIRYLRALLRTQGFTAVSSLSVAQTYSEKNLAPSSEAIDMSNAQMATPFRRIHELTRERETIIDSIYPLQQPNLKKLRRTVAPYKKLKLHLSPVRDYFLQNRQTMPTEAEWGDEVWRLSVFLQDESLSNVFRVVENDADNERRKRNLALLEAFTDHHNNLISFAKYARAIYHMDELADLSRAPFRRKFKLSVNDAQAIIQIVKDTAENIDKLHFVTSFHPALLYGVVKIYNNTYPPDQHIEFSQGFRGYPISIREAFENLSIELQSDRDCQSTWTED